MADEQHLQQARSELEGAVETAGDDVRDDLRDTATAFAELAAGDRQADHAVFDEYLNTLRQAREQSDADTANSIDRALEHAETYREDLEQA